MKEERFPAPWEDSSPVEKLDWTEGGVLERKRGEQQPVCGRQKWRVTCTAGWNLYPALHNLSYSPVGEGRVWVLKPRL